MNEIVEELKIEKMIYEIRGKQVMLDSDLAKLYQVETKRINEAVSRNKEKFPVRFSFTISEKEYNLLKSQIATSKGGSRKGHRVFTEQGVAMLATILKSKIATEVSIRIMDAFVAMRKYIGNNLIEQRYINHLVIEHEDKIKLLETSFEKLETKRINETVKNNLEKFPERFSWKLTNEESKVFLVEIFDQKIERRGGRYKEPRVFTKKGVAMLATILRTNVAEEEIVIIDSYAYKKCFINEMFQKLLMNKIGELEYE